jgi:hypothetical protein
MFTNNQQTKHSWSNFKQETKNEEKKREESENRDVVPDSGGSQTGNL